MNYKVVHWCTQLQEAYMGLKRWWEKRCVLDREAHNQKLLEVLTKLLEVLTQLMTLPANNQKWDKARSRIGLTIIRNAQGYLKDMFERDSAGKQLDSHTQAEAILKSIKGFTLRIINKLAEV